ncbi:class I SAM-dependent methyltransferase [Leekyejoonella antrihumi]|uniref:Methyltransferase n=1 Tax=Leekyejoonella antrihumi TaxID=1660198 RepID=A0A563E5U7_9MICO|nr:methyltransferase [Leekyejoonella antrihumi]TWP37592.1 methyltransferase [Leekyejoonella antrihumi]
MSDHYFTAQPASDDERRTMNVPLAGATREIVTAPGIFSPDRIDQGTTVLLTHAPPPPSTGTFLDLGCGWGPVALTLALAAPAATVWAVDVNERALDLTRTNARSLGLSGVTATTPDALPAEVRFDLIWSNPPIRVGKKVLHDLMRTWLPRMSEHGTAYLVVQRNLGSDSLQRWLNDELSGDGLVTTRYTSIRGFRILQVTREG